MFTGFGIVKGAFTVLASSKKCPRNWYRGKSSRNWHRDRLKEMPMEFASWEERREKILSSSKEDHVGLKLPVEFMRRFITRKCNLLRDYGNISSLAPPISGLLVIN